MAKHIVVLGAGYGGLMSALEARKRLTVDDARISLVNKHSYHQLVTQLHETAVGARSDRASRVLIEKVVHGKDIDVVKGTVSRIVPDQRVVELADGQTLEYDYLVVALGSEAEYFGIEGMKENAFIMKTINQARLIRVHIQSCFARYAYERRPELLRFVVGGAGFSGIELVGELADALPRLAAETGVDYSLVELYNVEAMPSILPGFDPELVKTAEESLRARGVRFRTGVAVAKVEPGLVHLKDGSVIETDTMIWTGGVRGNQLVVDAGFETEPRGRAKVDAYLQSVNIPNTYLVGDCAFVLGANGRPLPPTAQLAWQMGAAAGQALYHDIKGGVKEEFKPVIMGTLASLGRKDCVGKVGKSTKLHGRMAYLVKEAGNYRYLAKIGSVFH